VLDSTIFIPGMAQFSYSQVAAPGLRSTDICTVQINAETQGMLNYTLSGAVRFFVFAGGGNQPGRLTCYRPLLLD
jgi:hypothetical protein